MGLGMRENFLKMYSIYSQSVKRNKFTGRGITVYNDKWEPTVIIKLLKRVTTNILYTFFRERFLFLVSS
jgi:hypothetical protein